MRIWPVCYVCPRDWRSFEYLNESIETLRDSRVMPFHVYRDSGEPIGDAGDEYCVKHKIIVRCRPDGFFPWEGWISCMAKWGGYKYMVSNQEIHDDDYVMYCDSDVVIANNRIFNEFEPYDFLGFPHSAVFNIPRLNGWWTFFSGCFQVFRVSALRRVTQMTKDQLEDVKKELNLAGLSHNEDVMMSLAMSWVSPREKVKGFPSWWYARDLQDVITHPGSVSHYNGFRGVFLGERCENKWDVPDIVRKKGMDWK